MAADYFSWMPNESDQEVDDDEEYFEGHVYALSIPGHMDILRVGQRSDPVSSRAVIQLRDSGVLSDGQLKSQRGLRIVDALLLRSKCVVVPQPFVTR